MDEDNEDGCRISDEIPILDRDEIDKSDAAPRVTGETLKGLVDRLLAQPLSKADANFSAIFLCLYRKFAAPGELLDTMVAQFDVLDKGDAQHMLRLSTQLRHLSIMSQWVNEYPGDFANTATRQRLAQFVSRLSHNRAFAVAAKEMQSQLEVVVPDDDVSWARADAEQDRPNTMDSFFSTTSNHSTASTLLADLNIDEHSKETASHTVVEGEGDPGKASTRSSGAPSNSSSGAHSSSWSSASFHTLYSSIEGAEREAQRLVPTPRIPFAKLQWHQFMDILDEDIAEELTRIDWIMFSSIRPRDLVRHVSLSTVQKESCKNLENVNRMISHFNHVAYWVSNLILLRDKPKHRAKALEKFMSVAWKLRQMNNYNSLGAVIAGINANAVHRLSQTRELVTLQAQKDFMRLEILMGTQKSHFAYRLAWENTSTGRIPFLPLHRRDLVSAEEGNRTFVGDDVKRINWKKFEIMGEVIVGIQKSQGTPYAELNRCPEVQRLVLEGDFIKDDEILHERSVSLEPPGTGANVNDGTRKKFAWFQR
ncbi:MAG: hypothetical protein M1817_002684 [Caeruleum heppii]|nr:MAG: hypothetical protein M1817_002684 [Caeruleum heppii]